MRLGMDKGQNIAFFRCEKGVDKSFGLCGGKDTSLFILGLIRGKNEIVTF